jgi:flagellar FliL protein
VAEKEKEEKPKKDAPEKKEGEEAAGEGGEDGLGEPTKKSKKKLLIVAGAALVLLLGGGAGLFFSGAFGSKAPPPEAGAEETGHSGEAGKDAKDAKEKEAKADKNAKPAFYQLGDILVNLNSDPRHPNFLKIKVALELADEKDSTALDALKPRIIDNFQVYLRELRIEDLRGSAGLYRLREELLLRVTEAVAPIRVRDVLFQEMLVQ